MLEMPDSLKQRRLQRKLPHVIGSLSETAYADLINGFGDASPEFIIDFQEASRQVLGNTYSQGIINSNESITKDITDQIRINDQVMSVTAIYTAEDLKQDGLIPIIKGFPVLTQSCSAASVQELLSLFIIENLKVDSVQTERLRREAQRSVAVSIARYAHDQLIIDQNILVTYFTLRIPRRKT